MTSEGLEDVPAALCDEHLFRRLPRDQDASTTRAIRREDSLPVLTPRLI